MLEILTDNELRLMAENEELRVKMASLQQFCIGSLDNSLPFEYKDGYWDAQSIVNDIINL